MKVHRTALAVVAGLGLFSFATYFTYAAPKPAAPRITGSPTTLGKGTAASYAEFDARGLPKAIGVIFSGNALFDLPTASSDGHRCLDADGDGKIDQTTECS